MVVKENPDRKKKVYFICSTHFCWTPLTKCVFIFLNFYICRSIHFFSIFRFFCCFFFFHWKDITFEFLKMPCCLYLYTVYQCEYFSGNCWETPPIFVKMVFSGVDLPPLRKLKDIPDNENTSDVSIIQSQFSVYCLISAWKNYSTKGLRFHPRNATSIYYFSRILKITGYKK